MEQKTTREISPGRRFLFLVIIFFVLVLLIEGLASMYYYQRNGGERIATLETARAIREIFKPEADRLVYEPWVEYRNKNFQSESMQTAEFVRRSIPDSYGGKAGDTLDIYFFGGSTLFGENVADSQTIPSQFVQLYKSRFPNAGSIRVFNYGIHNYYSYQELILLVDLIQKGYRPGVLIFLDGINDFRFGNASYYNQSSFSYIYRQFFDSGLRSAGEFKFLDTVDALCKNPVYIPVEEFNKGLLANYVSNIGNIKMLADMINAKAYFFCQPSPFYHYAGPPTDPACAEDVNARFQSIYPALERLQDSLPGFTYLGNMVGGEEEYPFIDSIHYSPLFNKKIAEHILARMENDPTLPLGR